jgi:hypothetical protein
MVKKKIEVQNDNDPKDQKEDKNGKSYTDRINTRRPDLQQRISNLRSSVEAFNEKFTKEYEGGPKFSKSDRQGSQGADVQLTHWGRTGGLKK